VMLATLRDTLASLAASYPTRAADDELLLGMASLTHPRLRSAVHVRLREQQLLHHAATLIDALEVPPAAPSFPPVGAHRFGAMLLRG
jgi:hypothetical protein